MSDEEVVETFYGKHHRYDVLKQSGGAFTSAKYYIHKDGKTFKGPYSGLSDAVDAARREA